MGMRIFNLKKSQRRLKLKQLRREENQRRALLKELKSVPCADCGLEFPTEVMDFDHVPGRGGKLGEVSSRKSLRAILEEARKCDVVCSNCHRMRTCRRRRSKREAEQERRNYLDGLAAAVEREREALRAVAGAGRKG